MQLPKDKRFIDLTGKKFNRLAVISYAGKINGTSKWNCVCKCGKEKTISGNNLKNGHTTSCGCYHREKIQEQILDLKGMKFGKLIVLEYAGWDKLYGRNCNAKYHLWKCKCDCGNIKNISGASLRSGKTKSCGCYHKEKIRERMIDLTGKTFGDLIVVKLGEKKSGNQAYWICKCKCGKTKEIAGNSLKSGKSKSCGCKQGGVIHGLADKPGYKAYLHKDPTKKIRHNVGGAVNRAVQSENGRKGGRTFDYLPYTPQELRDHLESLWEPWMNWDNYGGTNHDPRRTWHIDHIKPQTDFNYSSLKDPMFLECWSLENLRPLDKIENMQKGTK